jgi:hypothetical protein
VLVDPIPGTTLLDLGGLQVMLEELLGVQADTLPLKNRSVSRPYSMY